MNQEAFKERKGEYCTTTIKKITKEVIEIDQSLQIPKVHIYPWVSLGCNVIH